MQQAAGVKAAGVQRYLGGYACCQQQQENGHRQQQQQQQHPAGSSISSSMLARFSLRPKKSPHQQQQQQPQSAPASPLKKTPQRQHSYQPPPQPPPPSPNPSLLRSCRSAASPQLPRRLRHQGRHGNNNGCGKIFELPDTAPQRQTPVWVKDSPVQLLHQQQPQPEPSPATTAAAASATMQPHGNCCYATATAGVQTGPTNLKKRPSSKQQQQHPHNAVFGSQVSADLPHVDMEVRSQLRDSQETSKRLSSKLEAAIQRLELLEVQCRECQQDVSEREAQSSRISGRIDRLEQLSCDKRLAGLEKENSLLRQELLQAGRFTDELANQIIQNTLIQKNLTEECNYLRERLSEAERVNQQLTTALVSILTHSIDPHYLQQPASSPTSVPTRSDAASANPARLTALQEAVSRLMMSSDACERDTQCPPALCPQQQQHQQRGVPEKSQPAPQEDRSAPKSEYYTLDFTGPAPPTTAAESGTANRQVDETNSMARTRRDQSVLNLTATVGFAIAGGPVAVDLETFVRARQRLDKHRARLNRLSVCSDSELLTDRFVILSDAEDEAAGCGAGSTTNDEATAGRTTTASSQSDLSDAKDVQERPPAPPPPPLQHQQPPPVQIHRKIFAEATTTAATTASSLSGSDLTASCRSSTPPPQPPPRRPFVVNGNNGITLPYATKQQQQQAAAAKDAGSFHPPLHTTATGVYPSSDDDLYIDDDFEVQEPVFGGLADDASLLDQDDLVDDDDELLREIERYQLPSSSFA